MGLIRFILIAALLTALTGCTGFMLTKEQKDAMEKANTQEVEMVGTISKGHAMDGMEDTGWLFATVMMDGGSLSMDVSRVQAAAEANVGKRVVVKFTGLGGGAAAAGHSMPAIKVISIEPVGATPTTAP